MTSKNIEFLEFFNQFIHRHFPRCKNSDNWHVKVICKYLEQITEVENRRLIINLPPRHMKSMIVSVAWPAWLLGRDPRCSIIVASYSQRLSAKHSVDTRNVMRSHWYRSLFPNVNLSKDQNSKLKFSTTENGFRMATSIGGTLTGEGGDFLILDDPMTPMQASSTKVRQNILDWYDQTFLTRLNDRRAGVIVLVMHRLHVEDLSGYLLSKPGYMWKHLSLPFIEEKGGKVITSLDNVPIHTREAGEFIYGDMSEKEVEQLKLELGSYTFSSQYQQNPLEIERGLIQRSWFRRHNWLPNGGSIVQSWDTASSISGDYSVCTTWKKIHNIFYLINVVRGRWNYVDLKKLVLQEYISQNASLVLIENASSGQQLIQELKLKSQMNIVAITSKDAKIARVEKILHVIEAGRVSLPKDSIWLTDFESEIFLFPKASNDDQVDSMAQFLIWADNKYRNQISIKTF